MLVTLMPTTIRPNSFFMQLIIHFMRLHHKKYSYGFISHVLWTKHCIFHSSWGAFFTYFPPNKRCHLWWCFGKIQPYQDLSESFKATRLKEDRDVAKAAIPRKMQNSYTAHRQSYIKGKSAVSFCLTKGNQDVWPLNLFFNSIFHKLFEVPSCIAAGGNVRQCSCFRKQSGSWFLRISVIMWRRHSTTRHALKSNENGCAHKNSHQMFTATLLTRAPKWKQSNCLPTHEWLNQVWDIYLQLQTDKMIWQ